MAQCDARNQMYYQRNHRRHHLPQAALLQLSYSELPDSSFHPSGTWGDPLSSSAKSG